MSIALVNSYAPNEDIPIQDDFIIKFFAFDISYTHTHCVWQFRFTCAFNRFELFILTDVVLGKQDNIEIVLVMRFVTVSGTRRRCYSMRRLAAGRPQVNAFRARIDLMFDLIRVYDQSAQPFRIIRL